MLVKYWIVEEYEDRLTRRVATCDEQYADRAPSICATLDSYENWFVDRHVIMDRNGRVVGDANGFYDEPVSYTAEGCMQ